MANLHDYYFRQRVTELELDEGFEFLEQADRDFVVDWDFPGLSQGAVVSEQGVPNLTVDVSNGVAYSNAGERIDIDSTPVLDLSVDENSVSTEPAVPGNSVVISIFVEFARALSDPRIDGNSATVYFNRFESFNFVIRTGSEAASPGGGAEEAFINANGSALDPNLILIADVIRANGQTTISNSDIYTTRTEYVFRLTAGGLSLTAGTAREAVQAMLQELEDHVTNVGAAHPADTVSFDPSGVPAAWSALAAATQVQAAIEAMLDDLVQSSGVVGATLVGVNGTIAGFAGTPTTVQAAFDDLFNGVGQIGFSASGGYEFNTDVAIGNNMTVDGTLTHTSSGENVMFDATTSQGIYSGAGTPEGVQVAAEGSLYFGNGAVYLKMPGTGTDNTGWAAISDFA